jgi:rhamnosyl/mannosyltransferase
MTNLAEEKAPLGGITPQEITSANATVRICHLGKYYPPAAGGIETHLQTLARSQAELGCQVEVICVNHRDRAERDVTWSARATTPTVMESDGPVRITRLGRLGSIAKLDLCPGLPRVLTRLQGSADVLHLHAPNPTMLLALVTCRPRVPLVITHHSDIVRQRFLRYLVAPFERWVYGSARLILADSPTYTPGSPVLGRYPAKVSDLPLGIDLSPYLTPSVSARESACRFRQKHGQPLWLFVGRLIYYKGLDVALRALRDVPGTLLVIGTGPLESSLRKEAAILGVADRVIWHGHASADELVGAYQAATALWFPSNARSEGFGLVQVEAMASGCPVINTAIPHSGVSWVSPDGETGLTVPVNDAPALANAARRLLDEPALRNQLGQNGRQRATEAFGQERMAQTSLQLYRRLLAPAA